MSDKAFALSLLAVDRFSVCSHKFPNSAKNSRLWYVDINLFVKLILFEIHPYQQLQPKKGPLSFTTLSPCHIMEPKDVATLKHLSEELQNDREILLHAAALSERDFEGQSWLFHGFFRESWSMSAIENRCIIWTYCIDPSRFGFNFKNTHLKNLDDFVHQNPFLHPFRFFFFRRSVLQETKISATRHAGFAARQRWWDGIPTAGSVQLDATCWSCCKLVIQAAFDVELMNW